MVYEIWRSVTSQITAMTVCCCCSAYVLLVFTRSQMVPENGDFRRDFVIEARIFSAQWCLFVGLFA